MKYFDTVEEAHKERLNKMRKRKGLENFRVNAKAVFFLEQWDELLCDWREVK